MSIHIEDLTVKFKNGVTAINHADLDIPNWLCGNSCSELCNTGKPWKNSTVCMVFYCLYFVECSIFYCKQHCLCITGYILY